MTDTEMNKILAHEFKNDFETITNFCLKDEDFYELCQDYTTVVKTILQLQNQKVCDKKKIMEFKEIQIELKLKILAFISVKQ